MSKKKTTEEFIEDAKLKYGNKYDYSKTIYQGNKIKVIITCPIHGDWEQKPNDHLTGYGCKQCGYETAGKKQKVTKMLKYDDKYWQDYLDTNYKNLKFISTTKHTQDGQMTIKCEKHSHTFKTSVATVIHKNKMLCPVCIKMNPIIQKKRIYTKSNNGYVYLTYIPAIDMYKLGFTTNVAKRAYGLGRKTKLIWQHETTFEKAAEFEKWIHDKYEKYRYYGDKKLINGGNTELYESDILVDYKAITTAFYEETHNLKKSKTGNSDQ